MTKRHDAVLDDVLQGFDSGERSKPKAAEKRGGDSFLKRSNKLASLASGQVVEKTWRWIDPARCRMWERHNRRYDLLNEQICADLIEGFKAQGRQEFPAIVRQIQGDPDFDFEVICGARRHWTVSWLRAHNYPDYQFLIEERDLSDEEAFRLSDIENRDRLDISDYERATDYLQAIEFYYEGKQRHMAERLEVSEDWLSRYLDLAKLPAIIVQAYGDVAELKVKHARLLKPLLNDRTTRNRVMAAAEELASLQEIAQREGRGLRNGQQVLKALQAAAQRKTPKKGKTRSVLVEYRSAAGKEMMSVSRQGRSGLVIRLAGNSGAKKEELMAAYERVLDEFAG